MDKERERDSSGRESPASSAASSAYNLPDDVWLECDDEVIRVLRMRELEDLLSRKPRASALTPYLLFYVQVSPFHQFQRPLLLITNQMFVENKTGYSHGSE